MYLLKQWRESRYISAIAILGLVLLLYLVIKGALKVDASNFNHSDGDFSMVFVPLFYVEAGLVGFWGWLIASIGIGKNLGEDSGSFLFSRPRSRAWFLWNDWGFAMAQIAAIIVLINLMVGLLLERILTLIQHSTPGYVLHFSVLFGGMLLISFGVLLFSGLIYSVTYFSTILVKRGMGVVLGAGVLVGYVVLDALLQHYYQIHLPSPIPDLFVLHGHTPVPLAGHLGITLAARTIVMLLFPIAGQLLLNRSEI